MNHGEAWSVSSRRASRVTVDSSFAGRECVDKDCARKPYELVKRMKDVSLSCQDSVCSTFCEKDEDHNSAHKYGGAGHSSKESNTRPSDVFFQTKVMGLKPSLLCQIREKRNATKQSRIALKSGGADHYSNENKTRPFDTFLEKKGMAVKPTILELNREKKKASKGYTGIVLRPGMVLLKNYLSINDQVMIVNRCREVGLGEGGFYQPGYRDGALLHLKMMCLGKHWDPQTCQFGETRKVDGSIPPKIPVEFNQFVEKAIKESQSLFATTSSNKMKGEDEIPFMSPDICIVNFYTSTGRLGLHQDKGESETSIRKGLPIVSFSIGDSAEFLYGDHRDVKKAEMVVLESGDVLIFGGKSRNVFHGVKSILKDTAPKVLVQETSLRPGRLNLTFRQY